MPAISASAPGKVILFGEHAVVYGFPAIAVPVSQVRARAMITANPGARPGQVQIDAPGIDLSARLDELSDDHPIAVAVRGVQSELGLDHIPACSLRISSQIPVASGLGSSAAVTVAILRALSTFIGYPLENQRVSELAFEVEKLHHGTPSGIDNSVITFEKPVFFTKGETLRTFRVANPFTILIGDTGLSSPTRDTVGDVRKAWEKDPYTSERLFEAIGRIARAARQAIESGHTEALGPLMDENHASLQELGVSSVELDRLVSAARSAGALGAKLSGGGRGGNMIALVTLEIAPRVAQALREAGAVRTLSTEIKTK
jgi:mevalonate kinase